MTNFQKRSFQPEANFPRHAFFENLCLIKNNHSTSSRTLFLYYTFVYSFSEDYETFSFDTHRMTFTNLKSYLVNLNFCSFQFVGKRNLSHSIKIWFCCNEYFLQMLEPVLRLLLNIFAHGPSNTVLTFTPPESAPSGQFWGIYALIGGVRARLSHSERCS